MSNTNKQKLVSIITPLYNSSEFIDETIRSVLSQSYTNWEMIIVDDKSTDNGPQKVEEYASKDPRIKFIRQKVNMGSAAARNRAIEEANGSLIAFLDSDDLWTPDKLEVQVDFMLKNKIGFSFSSYMIIDEAGHHLSKMETPLKVSLHDMYSMNYIGCLTAMYDTSFFGKFIVPNLRKKQDYALWIEILNKFEFAHSTPETLALYRIRKNSLSSNKIDGIKHYWGVLDKIAKLPLYSSIWFTMKYMIFTTIKSKSPYLYKKVILAKHR